MTWPPAGGPRPARGVIRSVREDFRVDERLGFDADGTGEHVLLHIEKIGANTGWVAERLARFAGVRARDVGFAGRKDRHAVCRQYFSVWMPGAQPPDWMACRIEGVTILDVSRHGRKLRPGSHAGNRFEIVVRELQADSSALEQRLAAIGSLGAPNYFGAQRFGRDHSNLKLARAWFAGEAHPRGTQRSLALSAARAVIFNDVLAARVEAGTWTRAQPGDCLNLDGTGSFFLYEPADPGRDRGDARPGQTPLRQAPDDETASRLAAGDIHVTGPLWGEGELPSTGAVAALERDVAGRHGDLCAGLVQARLKHERRPLRIFPRSFQWRADGPTLTLGFELPRGAFATAVLDEFLDHG